MKANAFRALAISAALGSAVVLPACAPLVLGGAALGGAVVAADRRSVAQQLDDQTIETTLSRALANRFPGDSTHISVTSYSGKVLLTGEVPTEQVKAEAQAIAERTNKVTGVLNELHVGAPSSLSNRNFDTALTAKVHARLLEAQGVPKGAIKVVSERSVVYLLGRVGRSEGDAAAAAASRVDGVRQIVKFFDYIS